MACEVTLAAISVSCTDLYTGGLKSLMLFNRQDLADMVQSGAITPGEAVNYMMQEASADKEYGRELELASSRFNKTPTSFAALDMQARAGGLIPKSEGGDGSYEKWMMESGKGAAAAGKIDAAQLAENREAFTKQITNYTTASRLINEISSDPNLANQEDEVLLNPMDINEPIEGILISEEEKRIAPIL